MQNTQSFPSSKESLDSIYAFLGPIYQQCNCPSKVVDHLNLAIEEAFVNIVSYAKLTKEDQITFVVDSSAHALTISILDSGIRFNPLDVKEQPVDPTTDPKIGGLGIYLIRTFVQEVHWKYENQQNQLTLHQSW